MLFVRVAFVFEWLHYQYTPFFYHIHHTYRRALAKFHTSCHCLNFVRGAFNI